ncbi:MAG: DnaJ domain-containing protein [Myxococcota bacterium]
MAHVVAIASGHDPKRLRLSAAEGYLLSRIDGRTPWRLLREIGGIPPRDVDACLERWLADGVLELVGGRPSTGPAPASESRAKPATSPRMATDAATAPRAAASVPIDSRLLDPSLDIDCDVQRRILEFELSLSRPYHELLGVPAGADAKTVKRAYFKLSKEFHPDRYFRRQIGPYSVRLERIFKKVLEAHEILSDPELCQVENQAEGSVAESVDAAVEAASARAAEAGATPTATPVAASARAGVAPAATGAPSASPAASANAATARAAATAVRPEPAEAATPASPGATPDEKKPLSKLERLKQRMPFKIDQAAFAARRARAREIFQAAEASLAAGRLNEAEANIRIAITFDPARAEFKEALGSLRIRAAGDRAAKLLETPTDRMSEVELREVLRLIEDVLPYRPHDAELNVRAAGVCLRLGKHDEAAEYVETLLETAPDVASHHSLRGRIERDRGNLVAARAAFEKALGLDREDLEARRALASMRIAAHDAARGGRR